MEDHTNQSYSVIGKRHVQEALRKKRPARPNTPLIVPFPICWKAQFCAAPWPMPGSEYRHVKSPAAPGVKAVITAADTGNVLWGHSPARFDGTYPGG